jgi:hypothetical protein
MTGVDVLRMQLDGSFNLIRTRIEDVTDQEWDQRAYHATSKLGFILWHCARILDWTVNSAIQGKPEVADHGPWRELFPQKGRYGAGISDADADRVADSVSRTATLEYLSEVHAAVTAWFDAQTPETLDTIPPLKSNQEARPGYMDPAVWVEVEDLDGLQAWQLLARPCISHIRVHVGEFGVLLSALRSRASLPSS